VFFSFIVRLQCGTEETTMTRLAGKVAFISGGGTGIGRATAERFAREGARVAIAEVNPALGEEAAAAARASAKDGGDAVFIPCDVRKADSVRAALDETVKRFGKLTILHNNAGGSTPQDGPVTTAPDEEFWRVMTLDVYGTFLCSKYGIPHIARAGGGAVINMSSTLAVIGVPGRDCYTAAKGAIAAMTRSMAVEFAKDRIRVNAIAPSVTLSDRVRRLMEGSKDIEKLATQHLFGLGLPSHIADTAAFLASDDAAITTGQVLVVDSGASIA
jgi:NAD(P)-dependent dehydrogenase (short-subunit alcohol dehydrogenase family)